MAFQLPRQLKAFNLYLDGDSFAGRCDTITPPALNFLTEEHRAGGMDAPVEIEMGMELMVMTYVLSDYDPRIISLLGQPDVPLVARGGFQAQGQRPEPVILNATGLLKGAEMADWSAGTKSTMTITHTLTKFRYRQNGVQYVNIEINNMVRQFGETDQLAGLRDAI